MKSMMNRKNPSSEDGPENKVSLGVGGRHSTVVAFELRPWAARVRIMAPESFSDVAVLIDSALLREVNSADKKA